MTNVEPRRRALARARAEGALWSEAPSACWSFSTWWTTLLGSTYTSQVDGGLRRVHGLDPGLSECENGLMARFVMPEPAVFEPGSSKEMSLNFQIEIFYERSAGRIMHFYGSWQHADMGAGLTTDDEAVQAVILNNMASWDDQTEQLCSAVRR